MKNILGAFSLWWMATNLALSATPVEALQAQAPVLYRLYADNQNFQAKLSGYANQQGFRQPFENLATVVHEMVHIASAAHQGFFIDGTYYEPYLRTGIWPALTNEEVGPYLLAHERGVIFQLYASKTPKNHLGNLVDEINAYGHVLPFVCRNEPSSAEKQVKNMVGFLNLVEGYLRTLRTGLPAEYSRFVGQREARGAFVLVVQRAWTALRECGVPGEMIPAQESGYFIASAR